VSTKWVCPANDRRRAPAIWNMQDSQGQYGTDKTVNARNTGHIRQSRSFRVETVSTKWVCPANDRSSAPASRPHSFLSQQYVAEVLVVLATDRTFSRQLSQLWAVPTLGEQFLFSIALMCTTSRELQYKYQHRAAVDRENEVGVSSKRPQQRARLEAPQLHHRVPP